MLMIINILALGEGPAKRLDDTTITAEAEYHINSTQYERKFALSLHCNESNNLFLFMQQKYINSKQKIQK